MDLASEEQWREKVRSELRGKSWASAFRKKTADNIPIKPMYTERDRPSECVPILESTHQPWQRVFELQAGHDNSVLLNALQLGVDTVWIRFSKENETGGYYGHNNRELSHWRGIFSGVHLSMLRIVVVLGDEPDAEQAIFEALCPEKGNRHFLTDAIGDALLSTQDSGLPEGDCLSSTRLAQLFGATPQQELELHLRLWAQLHKKSAFSESIQIEIPADANIFETVAKIRALRQLWDAFCGCLDLDYTPTLVGVTSPRMLSDIDEYTNILRCTHAATAAIIGGCHGLNILPFDHRLQSCRAEGQRIAAILHGVLAEEAHLGAIQDPLAGAYYIEHLTDTLAEQAWQSFREWSRGQASSLMDSGFRKALNQARFERVKAIAHRRRPVTSISEFPQLNIPIEPRSERWYYKKGSLHYDSDIFTNLRRVVESKSERPIMHILCIGKESDWTARYHFTLNAFAVGGWAHVLHSVSEVASVSDLLTSIPESEPVCLCAPDAVYTELAGLQGHNRAQLFLAGSPKYASLFDAKAIYTGCDLQALLANLNQIWELE